MVFIPRCSAFFSSETRPQVTSCGQADGDEPADSDDERKPVLPLVDMEQLRGKHVPAGVESASRRLQWLLKFAGAVNLQDAVRLSRLFAGQILVYSLREFQTPFDVSASISVPF